MKTGRLYLASAIVLGALSAIRVLAAPVDVGNSDESRAKAARQMQSYNQQPKEAFEACRGRSSAAPCSYVVAPVGTTYSRRVEGYCLAPESPTRVSLVCQ